MKTNFKSTINKILNVSNESDLQQIHDARFNNDFQFEEDKDYIQALMNEEDFLACDTVLTALPEEKTVIGSGVNVQGDIVVQGNMDVLGTVDGNITSYGDVHVSGTIHGNLSANQITMSNGKLYGRKMSAIDSIYIHHSLTNADIEGENIEVNGEVNGNLTALKLVAIKHDGILVGDVSAEFISIQEGAQIDGRFKTKKES